jgi:hypothetical protein
LWFLFLLIVAGAALLFAAASLGVVQARQAVQTVGRDAAPSIIAAQEIRAALADMDANAANALIVRAAGSNALDRRARLAGAAATIERILLVSESSPSRGLRGAPARGC